MGISCFPIISLGFSTNMNLCSKVSIIFPAVHNASATFRYTYYMTHALKNYSRVSTRLWNNFFWNNFQEIIFEGGRYTIMHVGI